MIMAAFAQESNSLIEFEQPTGTFDPQRHQSTSFGGRSMRAERLAMKDPGARGREVGGF
jgi:hypothetical protein